MKTGMFAFVFSIAVFALALAATLGLGSEVTAISGGHKMSLKKQTASRTNLTQPANLEVFDRAQALDSIIRENPIGIESEISTTNMLDSLSAAMDAGDVILEEPLISGDTIEIDTSAYADIGLDEFQIEVDTTDLPR